MNTLRLSLRLTCLCLSFALFRPEVSVAWNSESSLSGTQMKGYRGIWFTIGQSKSSYGDKYSGGLGTYTMKHIPMAVYAPKVDKTFFVFGGTPSAEKRYLLCAIGCFDHKTNTLSRPTVVCDKGVLGVDDPHDNPTVQIDKDGYVWVFVAGRANKRPGIRYKSLKPYDISAFAEMGSDIMAYPQVQYHPDNGFMLFFTRYDGVRQTFFRTSKDGITWSNYQQIASIKGPKEKKSGHYQFSTLCGKKLMLCFNRHLNGNPDKRTNIYYIQSEDWGKTWTTADGKIVQLPITQPEDISLVRNYQKEGKNCYIKDINYDAKGNPVILYLTSSNHLAGPDGGVRQWHTVYWNGTEWEYSDITTSTHSYDSGSIWVSKEGWTVIAPTDPGPQTWGTGGEMVTWKSSDKGKTWEKSDSLTIKSDRNQSYARRPLQANPGFYSFWADGNADKQSISYLYFSTEKGDVYRMPYTMNKDWEKPQKMEDIALANKVAKWQITHFYEREKPRNDLDWTNAILYRGMMEWALKTDHQDTENFVREIGEKKGWVCARRKYHADDIAVAQSYLMLYQKYKKPEMLLPVLLRADSIIAHPSTVPIDIKVKDPEGKMRWHWCDALIMAPPVYCVLSNITRDNKYIDFMDREYRLTTDSLYDKSARLYYRDSRYKSKTEANGAKVFWARGNAWVYAGLAMLLQEMPAGNPSYAYYKNLYLQMTESVLSAQDKNGSWHPSMLDPDAYPYPDNSASGLFTYGLAWGLNNGVLKGKKYENAAQKAWTALKSYVQEDGKLGYVQPIGSDPKPTTAEMTEVYGVGAFLLAASQMIIR